MTKTAIRCSDLEVISRILSDPVNKAIHDEVIKMNKKTKVKFSTGLKLIINKGMDAETAMEKSGFAEAFKKDCAKQKKAPETTPASTDPGA